MVQGTKDTGQPTANLYDLQTLHCTNKLKRVVICYFSCINEQLKCVEILL